MMNFVKHWYLPSQKLPKLENCPILTVKLYRDKNEMWQQGNLQKCFWKSEMGFVADSGEIINVCDVSLWRYIMPPVGMCEEEIVRSIDIKEYIEMNVKDIYRLKKRSKNEISSGGVA